MKAVYRADAGNCTLTSSDVVADDYQLKDNETFEDPSGKRSPAKLTATGGPWIDATEEEHKVYMEAQQKAWAAQNPGALQPQEPDKGDQALAALGQQVGQMMVNDAKRDQAVQALGQQLAMFIATNKNGGTN